MPNYRFDFRMDIAAAEISDERASGPGTAKLRIAVLPIAELRFRPGVSEGPLRRRKGCAATPWLRRQAGAKTFLDLAKLLVERVDT